MSFENSNTVHMSQPDVVILPAQRAHFSAQLLRGVGLHIKIDIDRGSIEEAKDLLRTVERTVARPGKTVKVIVCQFAKPKQIITSGSGYLPTSKSSESAGKGCRPRRASHIEISSDNVSKVRARSRVICIRRSSNRQQRTESHCPPFQ